MEINNVIVSRMEIRILNFLLKGTAESCMTSFMSSVPTDLNVRRPTLPKTVTNSHLVSLISHKKKLILI